MATSAASRAEPTLGDLGGIGLLQVPTARMFDADTLAAGFTWTPLYRHAFVTLQALPGVEMTLRQSGEALAGKDEIGIFRRPRPEAPPAPRGTALAGNLGRRPWSVRQPGVQCAVPDDEPPLVRHGLDTGSGLGPLRPAGFPWLQLLADRRGRDPHAGGWAVQRSVAEGRIYRRPVPRRTLALCRSSAALPGECRHGLAPPALDRSGSRLRTGPCRDAPGITDARCRHARQRSTREITATDHRNTPNAFESRATRSAAFRRRLRSAGMPVQAVRIDDDQATVWLDSVPDGPPARTAGRVARIMAARAPANVERLTVVLGPAELAGSAVSIPARRSGTGRPPCRLPGGNLANGGTGPGGFGRRMLRVWRRTAGRAGSLPGWSRL